LYNLKRRKVREGQCRKGRTIEQLGREKIQDEKEREVERENEGGIRGTTTTEVNKIRFGDLDSYERMRGKVEKD